MPNSKKREEYYNYDEIMNNTGLYGVSEGTSAQMNETFSQNEESKKLDAEKEAAKNQYMGLTNNQKLVSDETYATLGSTFKKPTAVTQADMYLTDALAKIQSGKTSYTDQIKDLMNQIKEREDFSYDADSDPLFQQALASAMNSGNLAMQHTLGQAASLTGGYGSSYATSAANQAYNSYLQSAYDTLPEYFEMAFAQYQAEGDELYRQLGMYNEADAVEYNRMINAFNATSAYRNQAYNESYTNYRDAKADAMSVADLSLSEHNQLVNDAYNAYNIASDHANTAYERQYLEWQDRVNNAYKQAGLEMDTAWNYANFGESLFQNDRNFESDEVYRTQQQKNFETELAANNAYRNRQLKLQEESEAFSQAESNRKYAIETGDTNFNGKLDPDEIEKIKEIEAAVTESGPDPLLTELEDRLANAKATTNEEIERIIDDPRYEDLFVGEEGDQLKTKLVNRYSLDNFSERTWTMVQNSEDDKHFVFEDNYKNRYSAQGLYDAIVKSQEMSEDEAKQFVNWVIRNVAGSTKKFEPKSKES